MHNNNPDNPDNPVELTIEQVQRLIDKDGIWSCNPADIKPWTQEEKDELKRFLGEVFDWKKESDDA